MPSLTKRDVHIVVDLHYARYMTTPQISKLYWRETRGGDSRLRATQSRVKILADMEVLRAIEQPVRMGEGRKPRIYAPGKNAVPVLEHELGVTSRDIDWTPKTHEENYMFMAHLLATNDIRIAFELGCELHPELELERYAYEREIRDDPDVVEITRPAGKPKKVTVVPDFDIGIRRKTQVLNGVVEIDMGTVTITSRKPKYRTWSKKIEAYNVYFGKRNVKIDGEMISAFQARYQTPGGRVFTVTTSPTRLEGLIDATEKAGGKARFWFTTFDQLDETTVFTKPIWLVASKRDEGLKTLL